MKSIVMSDYEVKEQPLWWQKRGLSYTASGYGSKIPTRHMIKVDNRWHRIYVAIYSNVGSAYIVLNGKEVFIENV